MNEMIGYVFGNLKLTETAIRGIRKRLREQKRFNQVILFMFSTMTAHVLFDNTEIKRLKAKIEKLESEIENLRTPKGE